MIIRPSPEWPPELPLRLADHHVVDARVPPSHQSELVELPVLVAVAAEPVARIVAPFIGEAHGDARALERPDVLDEPVVELLCPLALQELDDGRTTRQELGAIAPRTIYRVRERDA